MISLHHCLLTGSELKASPPVYVSHFIIYYYLYFITLKILKCLCLCILHPVHLHTLYLEANIFTKLYHPSKLLHHQFWKTVTCCSFINELVVLMTPSNRFCANFIFKNDNIIKVYSRWAKQYFFILYLYFIYMYIFGDQLIQWWCIDFNLFLFCWFPVLIIFYATLNVNFLLLNESGHLFVEFLSLSRCRRPLQTILSADAAVYLCTEALCVLVLQLSHSNCRLEVKLNVFSGWSQI